jgi:hypothetical protein
MDAETFYEYAVSVVITAVICSILALLTGCQSFEGERTSTIKLNILGNTWESTTTCTGKYPEASEGTPQK